MKFHIATLNGKGTLCGKGRHKGPSIDSNCPACRAVLESMSTAGPGRPDLSPDDFEVISTALQWYADDRVACAKTSDKEDLLANATAAHHALDVMARVKRAHTLTLFFLCNDDPDYELFVKAEDRDGAMKAWAAYYSDDETGPTDESWVRVFAVPEGAPEGALAWGDTVREIKKEAI